MIRPALTAAAVAILLVGCGSAQAPRTAACWSGSDSSAMCIEQTLQSPDDPMYVASTCHDVGGRMSEHCPVTNLVGRCQRRSRVPTGQGYADREVQVFDYRHPDVRTEADDQAVRARCKGGHWFAPGAPE